MLADELNVKGNVPRTGPSPSFSDIEVIALALTVAYLSIDLEGLASYLCHL